MGFEALLKGKNTLSLFNQSYICYSASCRELEKRYSEFSFSRDFIFTWREEGHLAALQKNFFSILMTSILISSDIPRERVISYAGILTCLRQTITSVDNIIDHEEKGVVLLKNVENQIVNNSIVVIASQGVLMGLLRDLSEDDRAYHSIMDKFYTIAVGEEKRSLSLYGSYPLPETIESEIHRGIGGALLELALSAPLILESSPRLIPYSRGLFHIGMALQKVDDLCDIAEDHVEDKANLATSLLLKEGRTDIASLGNLSLEILISTQEDFLKSYLGLVAEDLLHGFALLQEGGYPLEREDLIALIQTLFNIRGMGRLWSLMKDSI